MHYLQKHVGDAGRSAHLMDMVSMVSVAMPVLLSMPVSLIAFMVRMHAVLGPCGLHHMAQSHSIDAECVCLNKAISTTGY